jgi:hypothetical protein
MPKSVRDLSATCSPAPPRNHAVPLCGSTSIAMRQAAIRGCSGSCSMTPVGRPSGPRNAMWLSVQMMVARGCRTASGGAPRRRVSSSHRIVAMFARTRGTSAITTAGSSPMCAYWNPAAAVSTGAGGGTDWRATTAGPDFRTGTALGRRPPAPCRDIAAIVRASPSSALAAESTSRGRPLPGVDPRCWSVCTSSWTSSARPSSCSGA